MRDSRVHNTRASTLQVVLSIKNKTRKPLIKNELFLFFPVGEFFNIEYYTRGYIS
jgi:hypothetical protein